MNLYKNEGYLLPQIAFFFNREDSVLIHWNIFWPTQMVKNLSV